MEPNSPNSHNNPDEQGWNFKVYKRRHSDQKTMVQTDGKTENSKINPCINHLLIFNKVPRTHNGEDQPLQ